MPVCHKGQIWSKSYPFDSTHFGVFCWFLWSYFWSFAKNAYFSIYFSGAILEQLTEHKDLHVLLNFWIHEQAFAILFQNFNSMSDYRDISLQSWRPKWTKDDHCQWAKFNHFHIVRGLPAMQSKNLQCISIYLFFFSTMILLFYPNYVLRAKYELKRIIAYNILNFYYANSEKIFF